MSLRLVLLLITLTGPACGEEPTTELLLECEGSLDGYCTGVFTEADGQLPIEQHVSIEAREIIGDLHEQDVRWLDLVEASVEPIDGDGCVYTAPTCQGGGCAFDITLERPGVCVLLIRVAADDAEAAGCIDLAFCAGDDSAACADQLAAPRARCQSRL